MSAAGTDTVGADPNDNNFPPVMMVSPLARLMAKTREAQRKADIFYSTDPPEDESPEVHVPPPSIVQRLLPGIAPSTVYVGLGTLAFLWLIKRK